MINAAADELRQVVAVVDQATPGCQGRTMDLLWRSVFLGGDRGRGLEADLQAMGITEPSEELAEFLE